MRNFRDLEIWKSSLEFVSKIYELTKTLPDTEKFGLASQMNRSSVSISSNIAEGCRGTNKELTHFLNVALGSSFELETQLELCHLVGFIDSKMKEKFVSELNIIQKRINSFRTKVKEI